MKFVQRNTAIAKAWEPAKLRWIFIDLVDLSCLIGMIIPTMRHNEIRDRAVESLLELKDWRMKTTFDLINLCFYWTPTSHAGLNLPMRGLVMRLWIFARLSGMGSTDMRIAKDVMWSQEHCTSPPKDLLAARVVHPSLLHSLVSGENNVDNVLAYCINIRLIMRLIKSLNSDSENLVLTGLVVDTLVVDSLGCQINIGGFFLREI